MIMLYIITGLSILMAIGFILHVVAIIKFKSLINKRDEYYITRMDGIEALVRTEFQAVLSQLEKL